MSFKRFDPEDIVLSSELITFPTWYTQTDGDTWSLPMTEAVEKGEDQGPSIDYYIDYYSGYESECEASSLETGSRVPKYDPTHSKALFSLAYAERPDRPAESKSVEDPTYANVIFGQYRSLVLGDEDSEFRFGNTRIGVEENPKGYADSFIALTIDRARFREKLDPNTAKINFGPDIIDTGSLEVPEGWEISGSAASLAPDVNSSRRYLDAGRVFDLAYYAILESGSGEDLVQKAKFLYPKDQEGEQISYGYFLPDIGVILFNMSDNGYLFRANPDATHDSETLYENTSDLDKVREFKEKIQSIDLRSQETVTSNFVFVRARNAEFNYSTNPSNITGSAGNLRHDVMINQPQSFITTVGLYNDSNDLLAVAKLSRPLIKDFTKEALIRIKLDY